MNDESDGGPSEDRSAVTAHDDNAGDEVIESIVCYSAEAVETVKNQEMNQTREVAVDDAVIADS